MGDEVQFLARRFIRAIEQQEESFKLHAILEQCVKEDFMKWTDANGLNVMHHAILLNSPESVELLFSKGYFGPPVEPKNNPYIHLACKLGHRTVANLLLQHRPEDNRASSKLIYIPSKTGDTIDGCISENGRKVTPLDIAAEEGHTECARMILNQVVLKLHPEKETSGDVCLACLADSPPTVKLLLRHKPDEEDVKKAVELALHGARSECLDLLLAYDVWTDDIFEKMNFFHVLYTFTAASTFGTGGYARLPKTTEVLIKHNHDVNSKTPPNTYPLYSLLNNSLCLHDYSETQNYLKCLKLLLDAGSDPNFDEMKHEIAQNKRGIKSRIGRPSFSSGLHCVLDTVETYAENLKSKSLAAKFVLDCSEILLRYTANINHVGALGGRGNRVFGSVLHQFGKTSVVLGVDYEIFRFLMRQGADPDTKVNGKHMFNTYCDTLFSRLCEIPPWKAIPDIMEDVDKIMEVCYYMSKPAVRETLDIFKKQYSRRQSDQLRHYIPHVIKELEERVRKVTQLKRLCALAVWKNCGRNAENVHKLPIKVKLKTDILPIQ